MCKFAPIFCLYLWLIALLPGAYADDRPDVDGLAQEIQRVYIINAKMFRKGDPGAPDVRLMQVVEKIKDLPQADVRRIVQYLVANPKNGSDFKVYIIIRYYFDVPDAAPVDDTFFYGDWSRTFVKDKKRFVNAMYPLIRTPGGDYEVSDDFMPTVFLGPPYDGLKEFDLFAAKFGHRFAHAKVE